MSFFPCFVVASYGCYCSYYSYSTRVEKEKEVLATQEHKKPTRKKTQEIQSQEKSDVFNINLQRAIFLKLNYKEGKKM